MTQFVDFTHLGNMPNINLNFIVNTFPFEIMAFGGKLIFQYFFQFGDWFMVLD